MGDSERIKSQLNHSINGEPWHGPSLFDALEGVTAVQAAARPIEDSHTIWELVLHITVWMDEVRRRLAGNGRDLPPEEGFPAQPSEPDDHLWREAREGAKRAVRELCEAVDSSVEARLDQPIAEGRDPVYHSLCGAYQHNAYHTGQIALLRKLV